MDHDSKHGDPRISGDERVRGNPAGDSINAWRLPSSGDVGADLIRLNADGKMAAIQSKWWTQWDGMERRDRSAIPLDEGCPTCAAEPWPGVDDDAASNLTVSASGYVFHGRAHGDLHAGNLLVGSLRASPILIDSAVYRLVPPAGVDAHHTDAPPGGEEHLEPVGVVTEKALRLLTHWRDIQLPTTSGEFGRLLTKPLMPDLIARRAARCAVRAAYHARDAVVHQDPSISRPVVGRFATQWLGLSPTDENIAATGNALLQAPLDGVHPDGDHAAVRGLRADTRDQRRAWRDLTETQLRGTRIASLDRPLRPDGLQQLTLLDTVGTFDKIGAGMNDWDDHRITRVLGALHPDERRVALALGHRYAGTWEQAALRCGLPAEFGERVRRKLKREGAKLTDRLAAGGRSAA